jgi:myo-inositol-1(or 4)-monophosphatase
LIDFIKHHMTRAGEICINHQHKLSSEEISYKSPRDLVTVVDKKVEDYLVNEIRKEFPGHDFIREEGEDILTGSRYCWIIDPVDGTTSYAHHQPYYSISVALREGDEIVAGAVYAPALGQFFSAAQGKGAFLNDAPITVSDCGVLSSSVLATGFACLRSEHEHNNLRYFNRLMPAIRDIRRCGSAALDMAYVAAGKYEGFWELNLNLYDISAGVVLVKEAGGTICDFQGGQDFPGKGIVATNGSITQELLSFLR